MLKTPNLHAEIQPGTSVPDYLRAILTVLQSFLNSIGRELLAPTYTSKTVTANYAVTPADRTIFANCTAQAITISLPSPQGIAGKDYWILKTDAAGANNVTIAAPSPFTVGGSSSVVLQTAVLLSVVVVSDGKEWQVFARSL